MFFSIILYATFLSLDEKPTKSHCFGSFFSFCNRNPKKTVHSDPARRPFFVFFFKTEMLPPQPAPLICYHKDERKASFLLCVVFFSLSVPAYIQ